MNNLFFLSGIARSGSTLLGSILNQNPDIYVSPTSPLMDLFCMVDQSLNQLNVQYTYDYQSCSENINSNLATLFYKHIDKKYVIDKHRGWPKNINNIKKYISLNPKVICTYRPTAEKIVSFLKLINKDPNNSVDKQLQDMGLELNTYNRSMLLWREYSSDPFFSLKDGLEHFPENIHIVRYDDLVSQPAKELQKIYNFLDIPSFNHTFTSIENTCAEQKDDKWGFQGLHDIRKDISKTSDNPKEVLGNQLYKFFSDIDSQLNLPTK